MSYRGINGGWYPVGYADTYCQTRKRNDAYLRDAAFPFHQTENHGDTNCHWCHQPVTLTGDTKRYTTENIIHEDPY